MDPTEPQGMGPDGVRSDCLEGIRCGWREGNEKAPRQLTRAAVTVYGDARDRELAELVAVFLILVHNGARYCILVPNSAS